MLRPIADITPIAVIGTTPIVLVVNPKKIAAKSVGELTALFKTKPDGYNYGSSGNGTILHLASVQLRRSQGSDGEAG